MSFENEIKQKKKLQKMRTSPLKLKSLKIMILVDLLVVAKKGGDYCPYTVAALKTETGDLPEVASEAGDLTAFTEEAGDLPEDESEACSILQLQQLQMTYLLQLHQK